MKEIPRGIMPRGKIDNVKQIIHLSLSPLVSYQDFNQTA